MPPRNQCCMPSAHLWASLRIHSTYHNKCFIVICAINIRKTCWLVVLLLSTYGWVIGLWSWNVWPRSPLGAGHLIPGGGVWLFCKKIICSQNLHRKIVRSIICGKKIICQKLPEKCKKKSLFRSVKRLIHITQYRDIGIIPAHLNEHEK